MTLTKIIGTALLALSATACSAPQQGRSGSPMPTPTPVVDHRQQYVAATTSPEQPLHETQTIGGKIVKVQIGGVDWSLDQMASGTHIFEWVLVEPSAGGSLRTLIYPSSKAILEGPARITYRVLPGGISSRQFVHEYMRSDFGTVSPNYFLESDGIILKDGIKRGK